MVRTTLICHPAQPRDGVRIDARAGLAEDGRLTFVYAVAADPTRVRVPTAADFARRADGLWEHTCFEAFIRAREPAYYELNFSPSGEWAAWRFGDYRSDREEVEIERPPLVEVAPRAFGFEVTAVVSLSEMPELIGFSRLRLNLAAVIEDHAGERSYFAARHASERPDFHHPEGFVLELAQNLLARAGGGR